MKLTIFGTVPVGTTDKVQAKIEQILAKRAELWVAQKPESLRMLECVRRKERAPAWSIQELLMTRLTVYENPDGPGYLVDLQPT